MHCDECNGTGINGGSLSEYAEDCQVCNGYGVIEYAIGTRVQVEGETATITDVTTNGWYEVHVDGQDDDLPTVAPELVVATGEPLVSLETVAAFVAAAVTPRKPNAHVAPVFTEILNTFAKGGR